MISFFTYLISNTINKKNINSYEIYKLNFLREIPVVVNFAYFNGLDPYEKVLVYIADYKTFISRLSLSSSITFIFRLNNGTLIYTDNPLKILLFNGEIINLNKSQSIFILDKSFQYEYNKQIFKVDLSKFEYSLHFQVY
ncbi:MAG: hypothetical protein QXR30_02155 [Candidatus Woesearchaeota archaeon]